MGQIQSADRVRRYVPCLEGIRGYGFLLVFFAHYFLPDQLAHPDTFRLKLLTALSSLGLFAVPAFFVLSGYLIGGILYDTRNRDGYFRVFYTRRILRVFPVYYLTLLVIAGFYAIRGISANYLFWTHFLYIQNLFPAYAHRPGGPVAMIHFWSLAVEEQFYLLWPLVVWLFPDKRKLMGIATVLIGLSCSLRLAAPLFSSSPKAILWFTPTQVDAILWGVLLGLIREDAIYERIKPFAKWVVLAGCATIVLLAIWKGEPWAKTYLGEEIWIPIVNFTAVAIIIAVMEENSMLNRACSQRWVCWLGSLSYSAYVFHLTFQSFFMNSLVPQLAEHMRHSLAVLTSGMLAFSLTLLLSILSYRWIEGPIMNLKQHIRYLPLQRPSKKQEMHEPVLARTGA
jgi:peptidoglycan/LPS O-acetylase OafA/YrhL